MLNFKKLSQALLLAVSLAFASSVVAVPSQAADTHISNKYTKSQEKAKKATENKGKNTEEYNNYVNNDEYKKAVNAPKNDNYTRDEIRTHQNYNESINQARDINLEAIRSLSAKYEKCRSNMGKDCADILANLNKKVAERDAAIKAADKEYQKGLKNLNKSEAYKEHKDALKTAEKAQKKEQQLSSQKIADDYIELAALENAKKTAYKEAEKARKERNKAEKKVAEACAKGTNSKECTNAKAKLNQANVKLKQLDTDISKYNEQIKENKKTTLSGVEVDASKNYGYYFEAEAEAGDAYIGRTIEEGKRNKKLNEASNTAQEKNKAYQSKVTEIKNAEKELAKLKARCGSDSETGECRNINTKEGEIKSLKKDANLLYQEKVAADKYLAKTTQEVGATRAQDAKEVAEATAKNRKEMAGALQKEAQADAALAAAQEKAAQKCKNRNSKACQKATAELEAAQQGALSAKQEANKLKAKYGASTDASSVLNEQDASEYNNAKMQAENVCKNDKTTDACKEATEKLNALATKHVDNATKRKEAKEAEIAALEEQLKEAAAACEYSQKLESKQGQAQDVDYCTQAELLKQDIALAQKQQELLESDLNAALKNLNNKNDKLAPIEEDHSGQEFLAFSTATGRVENGTYRGKIDYSNTDDIFKTVTLRAARIIVGLKPIVYIFAGFGLIAFAFAAIFNKISWKWFANIAIGLFLVANMGRLIEYMVLNTDKGTPQAPETATEFGNHLHEYFADTEYMWVDVVEPFTPTDVTTPEEDKPNTEVASSENPTADERGFCEAENKGGGLFGGGGFMSCVKDLVASGKKVVDAAKKVKNTVDTVKTAVDVATNAAQNIGEAIDKMGSGDLKQIINAVGEIGNNVNTIVASGGNVIRNTINNTSGIANDIQDVSKTREQQNALRVRRDSGEATNAVDAVMQSQKWDKESKSVERLYDGSIANNKKNGNNNGQTGFEDVVDKVTKGSQSVNNQLQGMKDNAYIGTQTVEGIMRSVGGSSALSGSGSSSIPSGSVLSSKADDLAQANKSYSQANSYAKNAANTASRLEKEAQNKEKAAQAAKDKCHRTGLTADCVAAELAQAEYEMAKEEAENARKEADNAEKERAEAEQKANQAAKAAAEEKVKTLKAESEAAQKAKDAAQKAYDEAKKSGDPEAIRKAEEDLREKEKAYKAANIEALKADAEYQSIIEDKEARAAAEEKIKAEDAGSKLLDEYNASKVAEEVTDALNTAQREAQAANRDLTKKQEDLLKAEKELREAQARAERSGSSVDIAAVAVAEEKVKQAKEAEEAAQQVADMKNELVEPLAEKAHAAKLEESKYLQEKAEEEIKEHTNNVAKATEEVNAANDQYAEAAKDADEARKKAESTMDPKDIAAAKAAAEARDKAKKDLDKAKADLDKEHQSLNQAKMDKVKAAQAEAELSQTSQDIEAGVLRNEADVLRDIYGGEMDPLTASQQLNDEYKKAVSAAQRAEYEAKSADEKAKRAQQAAEDAKKQAEKSGKDSDMRKAEELAKRAELAALEAEKAQQEADQASEPLKDLEYKAYAASVEANKYQQEVLEKTMSEAKANMDVCRANLKKQEDAKNAAYQRYKEAEASAYANRSDDAAVVGAKQAYDAYLEAQTAYAQAQKQLEAEMKRYNEAELELYSARTKEAELQEQKQSAKN